MILLDFNLMAQIGVAVGTLILAIATFAMAHQGKLQLNELKKQNLLSKSTYEPVLKCLDLKFVKNIPRITIGNIGQSRAQWIGISTHFHPSKLFHPIINPKLEFEGKIVFPEETINFPYKQGEMILDQKESGIFNSEILFGVASKDLNPFKGFNFEDLKDFLTKNNIQQVGIDIGIVGKNLMDETAPLTRITTFFVDLKKHETLEDAYLDAQKSDSKPYFLPLSTGEVSFLLGKIYRNLQRKKNSESDK